MIRVCLHVYVYIDIMECSSFACCRRGIVSKGMVYFRCYGLAVDRLEQTYVRAQRTCENVFSTQIRDNSPGWNQWLCRPKFTT
mmetsp:Transcript_39517/g.33354  ORF Transcript_39517/g.33354 Transcript_39517/m.33354 type:complete len:83 (-) Transcript_39517:1601-1849(-)